MALLHALSDKVAEVESETLYQRLSDVRDETLGDVVRDTLAKDEAKTIGDTHGEVKTNSLLDALLYLLA